MTWAELIALDPPPDPSWKVIVNDFDETTGTWHLREADINSIRFIGVTPIPGECNDYNADQPGPNNAVLIAR